MGTGFSCLENSSEARILWRSAEIVRFEIPRNFLTLNFNLHFWLLTVRNNLSWRLIFRPFVGSLLTPLGPSYSWVFPTNEIEVAMIAIDETTILMKRSKRRSSSPHSDQVWQRQSCDRPGVRWWRRNLPKICATRSESLLCLFKKSAASVVVVISLDLTNNTQNNSLYATISLKNRRFDGNLP